MQKWPAHRRLRAVLSKLSSPLLPTPTATRYTSNVGGLQGRVGKVRWSVDVLTGQPWIAFREWMMGWPIGWATKSAPLGTDRFLEWWHWHGTP